MCLGCRYFEVAVGRGPGCMVCTPWQWTECADSVCCGAPDISSRGMMMVVSLQEGRC